MPLHAVTLHVGVCTSYKRVCYNNERMLCRVTDQMNCSEHSRCVEVNARA